jgi:hypothetical protein
MADLTNSIASNKKIQDLQSELDSIKKDLEAPKFLTDQTSPKYAKDASAYYDPTVDDKQARIKYLTETIERLTGELQHPFTPKELVIQKVEQKVQNFGNMNKEFTNEFIANSYYYPVPRNSTEVINNNSTVTKDTSFMATRRGDINTEVTNLKKPEIVQKLQKTDLNTNKVKVEAESVTGKTIPVAKGTPGFKPVPEITSNVSSPVAANVVENKKVEPKVENKVDEKVQKK